MNPLNAKRYALIIEKAKELLILLEYEPDMNIVTNLIDSYQKPINDFNIKNYDICDPSSLDIQQYKINRKKWVHYEYGHNSIITLLIDKMPVDLESFKMYTLLRRKKNSRRFDRIGDSAFWKLYDTLKETIKNAILNEFTEINKDALSKIKMA